MDVFFAPSRIKDELIHFLKGNSCNTANGPFNLGCLGRLVQMNAVCFHSVGSWGAVVEVVVCWLRALR